MPVFLKNRRPELTEIMDKPDADARLLANTYRQFSLINRLLSQWRFVYKKHLRPHLHPARPDTVLDIGFGGGDIPLALAKWAQEDGLQLRISAIETDKRAFDFAQKLNSPNNVRFLLNSSTDLVKQAASFDFVISNHLLHHLDDESLHRILNEAEYLARKKVLFNDIKRSDFGYVLFSFISRILFSDSYIREDGLTSIKRSFTIKELQEAVPQGWMVKKKFPFRLLLIYDKNA